MGLGLTNIIGQDEAIKRLIEEANEGRIPHARLFYGPPGCGSLPLALAYARYLHCQHHSAEDACAQCPSCIKWKKLIHPDALFVFPTVAVKKGSSKLKLSDDFLPQWREMVTKNPYFGLNHWIEAIKAGNSQPTIYSEEADTLIRKLSLKPVERGWRLVLIWLPERMQLVCANKLLKLIEEPPERTLFLLVSEAPDKILPTILSRTQLFPLSKPTNEEVASMLRLEYGVDEVNSQCIAKATNGNVTEAIASIHISSELQQNLELYMQLMRLAYQRKIRELKAWSETLAGIGREAQKDFLEYAQRMTRESFIQNFGQPELNSLWQNELQFTSRFSPYINENNVMDMMAELETAQKHIEQNVNAKMVFFDFALKMIVLLKHR